MSTETVALRMGATPDHAHALEQACIQFNIETVAEKAIFLATIHHETGGFKKLEEGLHYSAKRLAEVWDRYALDPAVRPKKNRLPNTRAHGVAGNPMRLANDTYGGRMGNRLPNDGWDFRGRGDAQLTGRNNYTAYSKAVYGDDRVVLDPNMLLRAPDRSVSAGWFWHVNGCAEPARKGDLLTVSRIWNLGNRASKETPHGMDDRIKQRLRAELEFSLLQK